MSGPLAARAPFGGRRFTAIANVVLVPRCPSTNDLARALVERMVAEDTEIPVTAIVTTRQTAGRGRGGRTWETPGDGGVALSLVVPWPEGPERIRVPVSTGIRLARALRSRFGIGVQLKWPNDLMVGRRKLGGILVEARALDDGEGYAIVGLGLNLATGREALDAAGLPDATSLRLEGVAPEGLEGESGVLAVLEVLDLALEEEIPDLAEAFLEVSAHAVGDPLTVRRDEEVHEGKFLGLTPDGLLRLGTSSGEETLVSGEVSSF